MASCDRSETYSEDDNSWHQVPYWSADYGPTDHNTQADAFTQLPIMTPNGSQPHTVEPDPFFGSWGDASLAQVPTQHGNGQYPNPWGSEVLNDTAIDENMHDANPNAVRVEHGTFGYAPWRQDITPEHVEIDSTNTVRGVFAGSNRHAVLGEEYSGRPDDYHSIGHGTPGTQSLPSHTTPVSYTPTHEFAEQIVVPPSDAVSAQAPWSVLNPRDQGANTSIADQMAIQSFPGTDLVRFWARDQDVTVGTNDMDQSMMTIRPEDADPRFDWMDSSEYTLGGQQYDQYGSVVPQLHVPAYMPDGEGIDDGDTVPQHGQDQGTNNDQYLSVHSESATSCSEASSPMSATSPGAPEVMRCEECDREFQGDYRRGNLNRHRRLYHGSQSGYPCQDPNCPRVFRRQDSRLKHHRRHHPHLGEQAPIGRRGSYQAES